MIEEKSNEGIISENHFTEWYYSELLHPTKISYADEHVSRRQFHLSTKISLRLCTCHSELKTKTHVHMLTFVNGSKNAKQQRDILKVKCTLFFQSISITGPLNFPDCSFISYFSPLSLELRITDASPFEYKTRLFWFPKDPRLMGYKGMNLCDLPIGAFANAIEFNIFLHGRLFS